MLALQALLSKSGTESTEMRPSELSPVSPIEIDPCAFFLFSGVDRVDVKGGVYIFTAPHCVSICNEFA